MADTDIQHLEIQRSKILSIQFSPSPILGSFSTWMHGYA